MSVPAHVYGFEVKDYHTESAGTAIVEQIQARDGQRLALIDMQYLAGSTAHIASFMFAEGAGSRNACAVGAVAAQKDIVCDAAPKDPLGNAAAASDIIAYKVADGSWEFNTVGSVASNTITCSNNLAQAIPAGGKVMVFGVVGDNKSLRLSLTASVANKYGDGRLALVHPYIGEPFYLSIDNATAAGFLNLLVMAHINK